MRSCGANVVARVTTLPAWTWVPSAASVMRGVVSALQPIKVMPIMIMRQAEKNSRDRFMLIDHNLGLEQRDEFGKNHRGRAPDGIAVQLEKGYAYFCTAQLPVFFADDGIVEQVGETRGENLENFGSRCIQARFATAIIADKGGDPKLADRDIERR